MSLREAVAIAFSDTLNRAPTTQKQDALYDLAQFIETNPSINNSDEEGLHIIETIYNLYVSFVERNDLLKQYRLTVTIRDLTIEDATHISALGFDTLRNQDAPKMMHHHG